MEQVSSAPANFHPGSNPHHIINLEQLEFLASNGFEVVPHTLLSSPGSRDIDTAIANNNPANFPFPVDGLIMEYNDTAYGKSLGATGHHENRLIALKWKDELYTTKFLGVELATTRTGMVSITGLFESVEMDGATVSRAYLHNYNIFEQFQFGVGDTIQVYKANMIIPQIAENLTKSGTYKLPEKCPCCGGALSIQQTSGGTSQLFCDNPHCAAKLVQKFAHFCEKTRMNIEGLSATTLEKFIGHGWIRNFGDLYTLERHKEEIINTEGFGVKSYERLQAYIDKSRTCTLAKFIAGLGIPMVGRHAGRELDKCFGGSWEAFEQAIQNGFDFTSLPDFGATMHDNIYKWYNDAEEANTGYPLVTKTRGRENRYHLVCGLFAHELGHVLYTDFLQPQTQTNYMERGLWYPEPPTLHTSEDFANEKALWAYLKADPKNPEAVKEVSHHISNVLEDGYIENRMLNDFPGTLGFGLTVLREKMWEEMGTVTDLKQYEGDGSCHIFQSILEVMLSYVKYGKIKYGDEELDDIRIHTTFDLINELGCTVQNVYNQRSLASKRLRKALEGGEGRD